MMSPKSYYRYSFSFLVLICGNYPCTLVRAELFLGNFDTNTNPIQIGIALGVLAILFALSFVGYNYCCRALLPEGSVRVWRGQLGRGGLDPYLLETFPIFPYSEVEEHAHRPGNGPLECAVCLGEYEAADKLRLLPKCSHVFHVACVDTWLLVHTTCPLCRADLVPQYEEMSAGNSGRVYTSTGRADEIIVDVVVIDVNDEMKEGHFRKVRKSNSTGNLVKIERVEEGNWERFTLKLPEEVRNDMVTRNITKCRSSRQLV